MATTSVQYRQRAEALLAAADDMPIDTDDRLDAILRALVYSVMFLGAVQTEQKD